MASQRKHGKGKDIDRTSAWSEPVWDDRGFWLASRYGPDGQTIEYDYQYPQNNLEAQTETASESPEDPRTPGNTSGSLVSSSFYPDNPGTIENATRWAASPGGNSSYDRGSIQRSASPDYLSQGVYTTNTGSAEVGGSNLAQSFDSSRLHSVIGSALGTPSVTPYSLYGASSLESSFQRAAPIPQYSERGPYAPGHGADGISPSGNHESLSMNNIGNALPVINEHGGQGNRQMLANQPMKTIRREPHSDNYESLDRRYQAIHEKDQRKFWKIGRVFMMLWTEPARTPLVPQGGGTRNGSHFSTTYLGGTAYSEIRRFVVIAEGHGNTICSPIHTYSGQATLKPNLPEQQQHAIIYTSRKPPDEKWYYANDGSVVRENLAKDPIRVIRDQADSEGDLGSSSRLNYSKIYTVEKYVRVLNIGRVHQDSMETLQNNAFIKPRTEPPQKPKKPPSSKTTSKDNSQSSSSKHQDEDKKRDRHRESRT